MRKSLFSVGSAVFQGPQDKSPASLQTINYLPKQKTFGAKRKPLDFSLVREEEPQTPISPFEPQEAIPSPRTNPQQQLRHILESTNRTDEEAWLVYDNLKHLKFFGQFMKQNNEDNSEDNFLYICKKLSYEVHPAGSVIMMQGDYSNGKVYIVLTGELNIFIQGLPAKASSIPQTTQPVVQSVNQQTVNNSKEVTSKTVSIVFDEGNTMETPEGKKSIMPGNGLNLLGNPETLAKKHVKRESKMPLAPPPILDSRILDEDHGNTTNWGLSLHHIESSDKPGASKLKGNKPDTLRPSLNFMTLPSERDSAHPPVYRPDSRGIGKIGAGDASPSLSEIRETPKNSGKKNGNIGFDSFENEKIITQAQQQISYGTLVNKISEGSYFGEKALFSSGKRNATIITSTKTELLALNREDFKSVQGEFTKSRLLTIQFLRDIFPNIASVHTPSLLENLIYNCEIKTFPYKKAITLEGEPGEEFYVVFEGQCEFSKTVIYDNSSNLSFPTTENKQLFGLTRTKKETIVTSMVERGTFIGEEMLFNAKSVYEYTVRATSEKVRLVSFKKSKFFFRCPKKILEGLRDIYTAKKERNSHTLQDKLQLKAGPSATPRYNIQSQDGVKQIVSLERAPQSRQMLQIPGFHSRPSQMMMKSNSVRNSIKMTDVSNTPMEISPNGSQGTIDVNSGGNEGGKLKGNSSVKNLLYYIGNYVGGTNNINTGSTFENTDKKKDLEELQRIKTEASMMPIKSNTSLLSKAGELVNANSTAASSSSSQVNALVSARMFAKPPSSPKPSTAFTNFNHLFTGEAFLDIAMRANVLRSPERDLMSPPVTSPKHRRLVVPNKEKVKKDELEILQDEKELWNEIIRPPKHNRVMSSWAAERKLRGGTASVEHGNNQVKKEKSPDLLKFIQSAKEHVMEKKKKDTRHFMKKSLEMSWKMEKTASIISFGTPRVTSPSDNIRASHRSSSKSTTMYGAGFEKNVIMPKLRKGKKKRSTKSKLEDSIKEYMAANFGGGACGKQERSRSMQASKIDMKVQFYSGFD